VSAADPATRRKAVLRSPLHGRPTPCGIWRDLDARSFRPWLSDAENRPQTWAFAGSPNGIRTRVSTLRVFSGPIPLPAATPESCFDLRMRCFSRSRHFLTSPGRSRDERWWKFQTSWSSYRPNCLTRERDRFGQTVLGQFEMNQRRDDRGL
jgi:hypothetical protein